MVHHGTAGIYRTVYKSPVNENTYLTADLNNHTSTTMKEAIVYDATKASVLVLSLVIMLKRLAAG